MNILKNITTEKHLCKLLIIITRVTLDKKSKIMKDTKQFNQKPDSQLMNELTSLVKKKNVWKLTKNLYLQKMIFLKIFMIICMKLIMNGNNYKIKKSHMYV